MDDDLPFAAISRDIHQRIWDLPEAVQRRQQREQEEADRQQKALARQAYNRRMRQYMPQYYSRRSRHTVTLRPEQETRLQAEVQKHRYRPAVLLRRAAFAYFDRQPVIPRDLGDRLQAATAEIRRVGNSINQLAQRANSRGRSTLREVREARWLLAGLDAAVRRLLAGPDAAGGELPGGGPAA